MKNKLLLLITLSLLSCQGKNKVVSKVTVIIDTVYYSNTKIISEISTKLKNKNKMYNHGFYKSFFKNGNLESKLYFKNGEQLYSCYIYNSKGDLLQYSSFYKDKPFFICEYSENKDIVKTYGSILNRSIESSNDKNFVLTNESTEYIFFFSNIPNYIFSLDSVVLNGKKINNYSYSKCFEDFHLKIKFTEIGVNKIFIYCSSKSKVIGNPSFEGFLELNEFAVKFL